MGALATRQGGSIRGCTALMAAWVCGWVIASFACVWPTEALASAVQPQHIVISRGGLVQAIDQLATQADVQIVYSPESIHEETSLGLNGQYTPADALARILAGTGIGIQEIDDKTFVLRVSAHAATTVAVAGKGDTVKAVKTLDAVTLSGSLINSALIQTATPAYTMTRSDIEARGFTTIADALQGSIFSMGAVQGPSASGGFTQGAQTFSLFGLAPTYALLLVDGKPLAHFGELYNGSSSFNNISNIPLSMVDHIDVLPGGASSIYGSSAIAGVVNIVMKQHVDGLHTTAGVGGYSEGGGASRRFSASWGGRLGKLQILSALEVNDASPVWAYQRAATRGVQASPAGVFTPTPVVQIEQFGTAEKPTSSAVGYFSPPDGCSALRGLFDKSTFQTANLTSSKRTGTYCGSDEVNGYQTLANEDRRFSGLVRLKLDLNGQVSLYSNALFGFQKQKWNANLPYWNTQDFPGGYIEDYDSHAILLPKVRFAPEQIDGGYADGRMQRQYNLMYQADVGANGRFAEDGWSWDAHFLRSSDATRFVKPGISKIAVDDFFKKMFLGPLLGVDSAGLDQYRPNYQALYTPVDADQFKSFSSNNVGYAKTWFNDTQVKLSNNSWFTLPGGVAGGAALLEVGSEAWYEPLSPADRADDDFGHTVTSGGGRRRHSAVAAEINLPVADVLTLDASGRYDNFSIGSGRRNGKFTYKSGLEYRPAETILLRATYATSFQAPQLPAIYLGPSGSYQLLVDDYRCIASKSTNCAKYTASEFVTHEGNASLRPTTAQSWTMGGVWSTDRGASISLDYLHVAIRDEVVFQDANTLLGQEAKCRMSAYDPASSLCQQLIHPINGQISRNARGQLVGIKAYYVNLAGETSDSVVLSAKYKFAPNRLGRFFVSLNWSDMLRHKSWQYPGAPGLDLLANPNASVGFKSVTDAFLSWGMNDRWSTALYGRHVGRTPNYAAYTYGYAQAGAGDLPGQTTYNWNLDCRFDTHLKLTLAVNNVTNNMPPVDRSDTAYPYYNYLYYSMLGRQWMVEADYDF